VRFWGC